MEYSIIPFFTGQITTNELLFVYPKLIGGGEKRKEKEKFLGCHIYLSHRLLRWSYFFMKKQ